MKMVLDTDVVVAALRSPTGSSAALLSLARQQRITLLASVPLAIEYEATCSRPEHQLAAELTKREVEQFVDAVIAMIEPVQIHFLWRPSLRDPADEMVLEAAVNGRADAIVTFNQRDYAQSAGRFGVDIVLPRDILKRILL